MQNNLPNPVESMIMLVVSEYLAKNRTDLVRTLRRLPSTTNFMILKVENEPVKSEVCCRSRFKTQK